MIDVYGSYGNGCEVFEFFILMEKDGSGVFSNDVTFFVVLFVCLYLGLVE